MELPGTATECVLHDLPPRQTFTVTVVARTGDRAVGDAEPSAAATACTCGADPPVLCVAGRHRTRVRVTWEDPVLYGPATRAVGYVVHWREVRAGAAAADETTAEESGTLAVDARSFDVPCLKPGAR